MGKATRQRAELAARAMIGTPSNSTPIPLTWDDIMTELVKHIPTPVYKPDAESDNYLFRLCAGARAGIWYNKYRRAPIDNLKEAAIGWLNA